MRQKHNFVPLFRHLSLLCLLLHCHAQTRPEPRVPIFDPHHFQPSRSSCYDENGRPQRCVPDFINVAFTLEVEVSNTCGVRQPTRFCVQTGHMGTNKVCDICDARVPAYAHPAIYLTDFNNPDNETWWQSETMAEGMQFPNNVNLTIFFNKRFDITYVRLKFVSPRPESFVIYKKTEHGGEWIPWQYYSGSCRSTFKLPEKAPILPGNEAVAQCTREFSDISPLTGGNIAFSTLEGRPSAEIFEESEVLQNWVTAEEIRISLVRMNTFGDEIFGDNRVLRSYYYGISDFAVGGRCKCNGHANQCVKSTGQGAQQLVCDCQHNTAGVDCQECAPFYMDRPWRPATSMEANECLPCQCNGLSNRCFFDAQLFEETGHGGHCIDCAGNTQGPHCEFCMANHWRAEGELYCRPCQCNEIGSVESQCDASGKCHCKPGVGGQWCDQCLPGFYEFSSTGCKDCRCDPAGSFNNTPNCSPDSGSCTCKENVEGQRCDKCKPGHFQLSSKNLFGCTPCFCFGHSSICSPADGFYAVNVSSTFDEDTEEWSGGSERRPEDVQWAQLDNAAAISQLDDFPVYFQAPPKFLGDQRQAYNQFIHFTLRVQQNNPGPSKKDLVIVGANGQELVLPIFAQGNQLPSTREQNYRFRVHSHPSMQWSPTLRPLEFMAVLSNVSAIRVRGTYSKGDVGFLSNFSLGSASLTPNGALGERSDWVEQCKCNDAHVGQFCESCAHGYKRAHRFGGPLTKCIPCECHSHSDSCDAESGVCICQHDTAGDTCERCARGFYGDALQGQPDDCKKCDCPEDGPCILMGDGDTLCTECPEGYAGRKCEICAEESFGNPAQGILCQKCNCNGNTDPNAIGKCDTTTGECKRCIYHTTGWNCERCAAGYWGDALAEIKGDCKPCNCYAPGTVRPAQDYEQLECRQSDGQCACHPNVLGQRCDQCAPGFFNISSGSGCQSCECDPLGSVNQSCEVITGQCHCKPGVTGRKCDRCAPRHFGFGLDGCKQCDCDPIGAETPECDTITGQCLCHQNVEGRRCDQCSENRFNLRSGCPACDDCYALIQSRKNDINGSMSSLRESLDEIQNNPVTVNNADFDNRVQEVKTQVEALHSKAGQKFEGDDSLIRDQVVNLKEQLADAERAVESVQGNLRKIDTNSATVESQLGRFTADKEATQRELSVGINYVQTQGEQHLASAEDAANRYGEKSTQLSELAEEAKQLAQKQEQWKREIIQMTEQVRNSSMQALSDANEAIFGVSSSSQQIAALLANVQELQQRLNGTMKLAQEQSVETNRTHNEAAIMLSNVESVRIPNVVSGVFHADTEHVRNEGQQALKSAKSVGEEQAGVLAEASKTLADAREQLRRAQEKQRAVERTFNEVEAYNARTQAAFDLATKTWNDAKDSHDALSDFQAKVDASRTEAVEELAALSDIQQEISGAEQMTAEAEQAVGDAKQNADEAQAFAEEASLKADNLAKESTRLGEMAEQTTAKSAENREQLDALNGDIEALASTTKDFENQANSDTERSNEVAKKATFAESTARNLEEKLTESEKKLLFALDQLNSLDNVDDAQLSELEGLLEDAERRYQANDGEAKMQEKLKRAEADAAAEKRQIDGLLKELENLRGIRDSLPTRCYNLINLEQEGQ